MSSWPRRFPSSTAADFAVLEAGIVSEETYVEQGLYLGDVRDAAPPLPDADLPAGPRPRRVPDDGRVPTPVPRPHQPRRCRAARPTRPTTTCRSTARRTVGWRERTRFIRSAYEGADRFLGLAQSSCAIRPRSCRPTTASHRSSPRSTPAACWSTSVCCRRHRPRTAGPPRVRRSARPRRAGPAARCRSTSTSPDEIRRVVDSSRSRRPTKQRPSRRSRPPSSPSRIRTTGPVTGYPRAGRSSTAPSPRPRPATSRTVRVSTTDMAHPTRTGDLVVFSYPPYQFDAATPGTLIARSAFFGQHGYVPDVQDFAANINMRATFIAGGPGIARAGRVDGMRTIDIAPTIAYLLKVPEPQHSQGVVRLDLVSGRLVAHAGAADGPERLPRAARPDHHVDRRPERVGRRGRSAGHDVRRGGGAVPRRLAPASPPVTTSAHRRPTPDSWRTCRRSTSRTRGVSTPRRTATTSSTTASPGSRHIRRAPTSRSWEPTSSTRRPWRTRTGSRARTSSPTTASGSA